MSVLKDKKKAQSAVELAVILPFLIFFIMGALDLGKAFQIKVALNSAAQQGATFIAYNSWDEVGEWQFKCQFLIFNCKWVQNPGSGFTETKKAIRNITNSSGLTISDADIIIECTSVTIDPKDNPCQVGTPATVTIKYSFTPSLLHFLSGSINLSSSVSTLVLR
jgi:hypothetical protein